MADSQRKSYNLFDVNGQRASTYAGISIVDDTIYISRIYSGAASYLIYAYTYSAGTYTISLDYTGDLTKVRFLSTISFEGGTYNSYYNAYYKDFDSSKTMTVIFDSDFGIGFAFDGTNGGTGIVSDIMMNTGNQPKPHEPYGWQHSLRKLTAATEAVENPLYSDGTAITAYNIKGNTVQSGTPSPSNPVDVNGVGVRTENLFSTIWEQGSIDGDTGEDVSVDTTIRTDGYIGISQNKTYSISRSITGSYITLRFYDASKNFIGSGTSETIRLISGASNANPMNTNLNFCCFEVLAAAKYIRICDRTNDLSTQYMMVEGEYTAQTMPTYEPYGYKIPISSGGVTTNIYLGSTQTVRQIKKLVLTGGSDELWTNTTIDGLYRERLENLPRAAITECVCSHYKYRFANDDGNVFVNSTLYQCTFCDNVNAVDDTTWRTYLANQYANGTPVTVWYVLATAATAAVNEPLMKIGDYADTLSNAAQIPTTEGANSITVDTTVQPSEFTATWSGWHNAYVKEKSENLFDTFISGIAINTDTGAEVPSSSGFTSDFIPVEDNSIYSYTGGNDTISTCFFAYDSSKAYIGRSTNVRISSAAIKTVTTATSGYQVFANSLTGNTNPIAYIRVGHLSGTQEAVDSETIMLNSGSTALPYEPYWK